MQWNGAAYGAAIGVGCCLAVVAAGWTAPALARDAGDIIVTGSRLSPAQCADACPSVDRLEGEEVRDAPRASIETLLSRRPQFTPSLGETLSLANPGVATVDLRGLGSGRTLVLVDGHRLPPFAQSGVADVNMIPLALVRRVEVLSGGASAAYGSDAVAGVVNILLDHHMSGIHIDAGSRLTSRADGALRRLDVTAGTAPGGQGHAIFSLSYTERDRVLQADRAFAARSLSSATLAPMGNSMTATPTVLANSFVADANRYYQVAANGGLVPFYASYDAAPHADLQVPLKRIGATVLADRRIGAVRLDLSAAYTHAELPTQSSPTGTFGYAFTLRPDNALLSDTQRALLFGGSGLNPDGSRTVAIYRRLTELGDRSIDHDSDVWQVAATVSGGAGAMSWEVFARYGESRRRLLYHDDVSYARVTQALDAVTMTDGVACRDASGGCVPLHIFDTAPLSVGALTFVAAEGVQRDRTSQLVTGVAVRGGLGALRSPLAQEAAQFAAGVEYRRETARSDLDPAYASGDLIGFGKGRAFPAAGFDVGEAHAELRWPLVAGRRLAHSVDLSLAGRLSRYSTAGVVGAYRAGLDWSPVAGLRVDLAYQRAVRAPNLGELASPRSTGVGVVASDPCAGAGPTTDAALAALCIATGAPAGLIGAIAAPSGNLINAFYGGNAALAAERADTLSAGLTFRPAPVPGLELSAQYLRIAIRGAIDAFGGSAQAVVNGCYVVARDAASAYCRAIVRNGVTGGLSGGPEVGVQQYYANSAALDTSAIDLSARLSAPLAGGTVRAHLTGTWLDSLRRRPTPFAAVTECAGTFGYACGSVPQPRWRHVAGLRYLFGRVEAGMDWRHVGPVRADAQTASLVRRIPGYDYLDVDLAVTVGDRITLRLGADNLFDTDPPLVGSTASSPAFNIGNSFPSLYEALGTSVHLSVSVDL